MDTSDEAITSLFGGGKDGFEMPVVEAENVKKTAEPVEQLSEAAKKNRLRAASVMTKEWAPPKLGYGGLLGTSG